jgi:uncharacterized membrane protein
LRVITFLLSGVCHQYGGHCLVYGDHTLPLCARCMGTFLGMATALLVLRVIEPGRPGELPPWPALAVFGVLAAWWALDGVNSLAQTLFGQAPLYAPSNGLRLVTGVGLGLGMGALLYPIYHAAMWRRQAARRVLAQTWRLGTLLASGGLLAAVLLLWRSAPFWLWLTLSSVATLATLGLANGTLLVLLARREGRGEHWAECLPWLALGALMSLGEMSAMALLRRLLV